jgi:hypothetical protein
LTKEEFDQMRTLLKQFAETELDQWVAWRTQTRYGPVYISISRQPEPGASDEAYEPF